MIRLIILVLCVCGVLLGQSEPTGTITASGCTISEEQDTCTATVQWTGAGGEEGTNFVVYVSTDDDGTLHLFGYGEQGSASAPWIQKGKTYYFRLHIFTPDGFVGGLLSQSIVRAASY